jgi:DNA-binding XRE family transcriptional regulator
MKLRDIRVQRFLSMARLARMADISTSTVRDIEAGRHRPSMITAAKLAAALDLNVDDIDECRGVMGERAALAMV